MLIVLGEVAGVFWVLDLVSVGRPGHGPAHLFIESATESGLAWDFGKEEEGRPGSLPPEDACWTHSALWGGHPGGLEAWPLLDFVDPRNFFLLLSEGEG